MLWVGMHCWSKPGVGGNVLSLRQRRLKLHRQRRASTGGTDAGPDRVRHPLCRYHSSAVVTAKLVADGPVMAVEILPKQDNSVQMSCSSLLA